MHVTTYVTKYLIQYTIQSNTTGVNPANPITITGAHPLRHVIDRTHYTIPTRVTNTPVLCIDCFIRVILTLHKVNALLEYFDCSIGVYRTFFLKK